MPVPVACLSLHFLYNYHGIHQKTAGDDFCCVHHVAEGFTWCNLHGQLHRTRKKQSVIISISDLGKHNSVFKLNFFLKCSDEASAIDVVTYPWKPIKTIKSYVEHLAKTTAGVDTYSCFDPLYILMKVANNGGCKFSGFL